jgi:hypothetical protein
MTASVIAAKPKETGSAAVTPNNRLAISRDPAIVAGTPMTKPAETYERSFIRGCWLTQAEACATMCLQVTDKVAQTLVCVLERQSDAGVLTRRTPSL